jgi:hypothetical protein
VSRAVVKHSVAVKWQLRRHLPSFGGRHFESESLLMNTKWMAFTAIAALALAAPMASAQYPGGGTGGARGGTGGSPSHLPDPKRGGPVAEGPVSLQYQVQVQLEDLQDALRLTPAQQGIWGAYSDRLLKLADDIARARFVRRATGEDTALQQFDRLADVAHNRMTAVEDIAEAGKALYSSLSPDQKRTADRRLALIALQLAGSGTAVPVGGEGGSSGKRPATP